MKKLRKCKTKASKHSKLLVKQSKWIKAATKKKLTTTKLLLEALGRVLSHEAIGAVCSYLSFKSEMCKNDSDLERELYVWSLQP